MPITPIRPARTAGSRLPRRQQGMALVIGLIFLLITTLMAVTAMSGVVMQERMAGNLRNVSLAQTGAESAARAGEAWIREFHSKGDQLSGDCSALDRVFARSGSASDQADTACQANASRSEQFRSSRTWTAVPSGSFVQEFPVARIPDAQLGAYDGAGLARRPQFMIESLGPLKGLDSQGGQVGSFGGVDAAGSGSATPPPTVYRITGRSTGSTINVIRSVETYYVGIMGGANAPSPPPPPPPTP